MDEPEAALSCQNQLALLYLIEECVKQNCQFIIATHSPILLGFPDVQILSFDEGKVEEVDYKSTSSYQTMKLFLDRYDYFVINDTVESAVFQLKSILCAEHCKSVDLIEKLLSE